MSCACIVWKRRGTLKSRGIVGLWGKKGISRPCLTGLWHKGHPRKRRLAFQKSNSRSFCGSGSVSIVTTTPRGRLVLQTGLHVALCQQIVEWLSGTCKQKVKNLQLSMLLWNAVVLSAILRRFQRGFRPWVSLTLGWIWRRILYFTASFWGHKHNPWCKFRPSSTLLVWQCLQWQLSSGLFTVPNR